MELDRYQLDVIQDHYENGDGLTDEELDIIADVAVECIRDILSYFGENHFSIDEYEGDDGELILDITGGNLVILIGKHGKTLDAFQSLVSSIVSRRLGFRYPVVVDIEGYKNNRKERIRSIALQNAERAKKIRRPVKLPPMNAYERRLVHLCLTHDSDITTHSEGIDPNRCVVIKPLM